MIKAVVGLGNPGARYDGTRHNAGFEVLDEVARRRGLTFKRGWRIRGRLCMMRGDSGPVVLVKPKTFMNRSGDCVAALRRRNGLTPEEILVVVDDVDLPLGQLRLRAKGGAGGHNGLTSVIEQLGSQAFPRLRVGVGLRPAGEDLVDYVLSAFDPEERPVMSEATKVAADAVESAVRDGMSPAMTRYNAANGSKSE